MLKIRKNFPSVKVHTVKDYFALPKEKRTKWGIYLKPFALPMSGLLSPKEDGDEDGWYEWKQQIHKEFPVQGFVREYLLTTDFPLTFFIKRIGWKLGDWRWNIHRFFNPACPRFRKAFKRYEYKDISSAIVDINFALIQDFWHEEVIDGWVDWNSDDKHKEFFNWLRSAIYYIEAGRPELLRQADKELDKASELSRKLDYNTKYGELNRIEEEIKNKDTEILIEFMKRREGFWT